MKLIKFKRISIKKQLYLADGGVFGWMNWGLAVGGLKPDLRDCKSQFKNELLL